MRLATAAALFVLATAGTARAQPPEHDEQKYSPWQSTNYTLFASSASDAGVLYVRPHLTLAWGAPFWQFVGFDGYVITTDNFAAGYAGWRASLPFVDVQFGRRVTYAYNRRLLPLQRTYEKDDLSLGGGDERSVYSLTELEITPLAPIFGGVAFAEFHPMWIDGQKNHAVYEELIRTIVLPPFAMRSRIGYVYPVGPAKVGAMLEYLVTPGRPSNTTRVGPIVFFGFSKHVEGLFTTTLALSSPDDLGPYLSAYGFLGLRYRWAHRF